MSGAAAAASPCRSPASRATGWILLAVLLGFAGAVHHGLGPPQPGVEAWYAPSGFLLESSWSAALLDPPWLAFATFGGTAALLAIAVWLTTRSAVARTLALSAFAAVGLFVFYGLLAPFPWEFFGWRGSAVLGLVALCFGTALAAPVLAERWLRLRWPLRLALYLPFAVVAIAFLCNATGTDPSLRFALSPWPAVPVFGMEVGVLLAATVQVGAAAGLAVLARRKGAAGVALALAAGVGLPLALLALGGALGAFPFRAGARTFGVLGAVCAAALAVSAAPPTLRWARCTPTRRARHLGVAAALLAAPVVLGQVLAYVDYIVAREVHARRLIDALDRYYERESLYPDEVEPLVARGLLEEVPEPDIGLLGVAEGSEGFRYQGFGTSYLLEFTATRWVQCAYTPAPVYEEDERLEEGFEEEALGESWSCPSRPPELW